jgi:cation diffusion facilitator CzcD-associated flavoprotein CzcO
MKSVAIIGAGPAGLVAAKTLLHSYPKDTFSVSIFEHGNSIGGLWAVESNPQGMIHPEMRTNLSQFTVCFSDLAWDSLDLQPPPNIYPKAWQVNRYLEQYARKFIPDGTISFQTRVKAAKQVHIDGQSKWSLTVVGLENEIEEVKVFDYLITATGFFSEPKPISFELDGIDKMAPVLHSSKFRNLGDLSTTGKQPSTGKVIVVGGSHSGAEIAETSMSIESPCFFPRVFTRGFVKFLQARSDEFFS